MQRLFLFAAAFAVCSTVGCANARYVQKAGEEGVISIPSNTDAWPDYNRTNALKLIEKHIGPAYEIVEEREIVTGTTTTNVQDVNREATFNSTIPFLPAEKETTTTSTTSHPVTEYHIHYRKRTGSLTGFPGANPSALANTAQPGTTGVVQAGAAQVAPTNGVMPAHHTTTPQSVAPAAQAGFSSPLPPPDLSGIKRQ